MYRRNETVVEDIMENEGNDQDFSSHKKEAIKRIKDILAYISVELNCEFPKDLAIKLYNCSTGKENFVLNQNHARGIVDDWRFWEPYVNSNDCAQYVAHKLEVLCRIHCGVTYGFERGEATQKSFIGNFAEITSKIPDNMYTIINSSGLVALNGKICAVYKDDPRAAVAGSKIKKKSHESWTY